MANPQIITNLRRKRDDITAAIEAYERKIRWWSASQWVASLA